MSKVWIVLANAKIATIYSVSERSRHFTLIKTIFHDESALKNSDFITDKPGHYLKNSRELRGSFEKKLNAKDITILRFAKEICDALENGRTAPKPYKAIIIVAEPHFYGLINKQANRYIQEKIKHHLPKDYTHFSSKKLKEELEAVLDHELRLIFLSD